MKKNEPMCKVYRTFLFVTVLIGQTANADYPYSLVLDGPSSEFTKWTVEKIGKLTSKPVASLSDDEKKDLVDAKRTPVSLECFQNDKEKHALGIAQKMIVKAPLAAVASIVDDFESYQKMFIDLEEVKVISRDQNKVRIFWEQYVPVPLIPNVEFETWYILDSSMKDRKIYRYKLAKSDDIIYQDGFILLEKVSDNETRYIEFDFWDAHWGLATTLAPGRIWTDSVEGIFLSDVLIKLKAERGKEFMSEDGKEFQYKKMKKAAKEILESFPVSTCISNKKKPVL